jgi:hypothetical protein
MEASGFRISCAMPALISSSALKRSARAGHLLHLGPQRQVVEDRDDAAEGPASPSPTLVTATRTGLPWIVNSWRGARRPHRPAEEFGDLAREHLVDLPAADVVRSRSPRSFAPGR